MISVKYLTIEPRHWFETGSRAPICARAGSLWRRDLVYNRAWTTLRFGAAKPSRR
jgi:hypothetical protein